MPKTGETRFAESASIDSTWNGTITSKLPLQPVHELFREQAKRTPDAVALSCKGKEMTYRCLDEVTDHLANWLAERGIGPEKAVAVLAERSFFTIVSILSILKAGGCYLVLERDMPSSRLAYVLKDARPELLLVQGCRQVEFPDFDGSRVLDLDAGLEGIGTYTPFRGKVKTDPSHLAYISYTSGTTGNPKGVCVTHGAVSRLVKGEASISFSPETTCLQMAPVSFDASTLEIWGTLTNGGRLAIYPCDEVTPEGIAAVVEREAVNTVWLTAGLFHVMVDTNIDMFRHIRHVLAGGDVISKKHVEKLVHHVPAITFTNGYGPTENTTFTTTWSTQDGFYPDAGIPIGKPVNGTTVYILDSDLSPMPVGAIGDVYTGGAGLARCYLNMPRHTAERFIPNPYSAVPGERMYDTGDQAKWNDDGTIAFVGRKDSQVKINGYRVETGEIEAAIKTCPEIADAVVVVQTVETAKRIVAYVTPKQPGCASDSISAKLHAFLKDALPSYMLPWHISVISALPLTRNGKVDRNALPAIGKKPRALANEYVAPRTPTEAYLADLWGRILDIDPVGAEDDFFELGGHSLIVAQVISQIRSDQDVNILSRTLYLNPTLEQLASAIDEEKTKQKEEGHA
ncbi:non-ribosomal peptide synthetase [Brevibacillus sp. TJ4]|uniref:non-ribosomal peptide synthetase n=1 Tax=Brevibacillus sp. TJ4 TaxID=3234853 RepID=UPI0037D11920